MIMYTKKLREDGIHTTHFFCLYLIYIIIFVKSYKKLYRQNNWTEDYLSDNYDSDITLTWFSIISFWTITRAMQESRPI